jgi:hypothetical protein
MLNEQTCPIKSFKVCQEIEQHILDTSVGKQLS